MVFLIFYNIKYEFGIYLICGWCSYNFVRDFSIYMQHLVRKSVLWFVWEKNHFKCILHDKTVVGKNVYSDLVFQMLTLLLSNLWEKCTFSEWMCNMRWLLIFYWKKYYDLWLVFKDDCLIIVNKSVSSSFT